jgi:hypothetical protein
MERLSIIEWILITSLPMFIITAVLLWEKTKENQELRDKIEKLQK